MVKQTINKEILQAFEGRHVKVVFQDADHPQIAKGVLSKIGEDFILIRGDYSEQAISIQSILKVSRNIEERS